MICAICHREAKGFGYSPRLAGYVGKPSHACSMEHLNIIQEKKGMIDPTPNEETAALFGGSQGGEYLESIGKTNLAALSAEEWKTFLLCVVGGYSTKMMEYNSMPFEEKENQQGR